MYKLNCSAQQVQERPRYIQTLEEAQTAMLALADITVKIWKSELVSTTSDNSIELKTTDGRLQCKFSVEQAF